jgi:pimeloyl-ACP methyl ester carboxylesterase
MMLYPERLLSAAPCGAGWERKDDPNDHREEIAKALEEKSDFTPLFSAISPPGKMPGPGGLLSINYALNLTNDAKALASVMRSLDALIVSEEDLRACKVPSISIAGTNDPLRAGVDRMKDILANHETVYVEGTDHITTITDPKFVETLRAFLKKHSAQPAAQEVKPAA